VEDDRAGSPEVWRLIENLTEQVKANRLDLNALMARADASDVRADVAEARADAAEARADAAQGRADTMEARALIDREMLAELQADGELSREHAAEMEQALRSSRTIGAAIGMIMVSRELTEEQAFAVLAKASQDSNRKLRDIAALVIEGSSGRPAEV
jgi:hypothetical protein